MFSRSRKAYISGVPLAPMSCGQKADEGGVILQAGQLAGDDAEVFGALRHLDARQLFDRQRVGPVIGDRADVVQAVGVGHGAEVGFVLGDFFVIAMQVAEDRLQLHTRSPSSTTSMRKTPCVEGCCGPIEISSN